MRKEVPYRVFTMRVEGVNLDSLSLTDVAGYLHDFADLIGAESKPRFHGITRGSARFAARVPKEDEPQVRTRGLSLKTGDAPDEAIQAQSRISQRLALHRAKRATILDHNRDKIVEIPIAEPLIASSMQSAYKQTSLQGRVIRIGGKQNIVPVEIQDTDGASYMCRAERDLAKQLAQEIFGRTIRVKGRGKWSRAADGVWAVSDFTIASFDVLEDESLEAVVGELRSIDSPWRELQDPLAEIARIRRGVIK